MRDGAGPRTPTAPAVEGAYQLGRGEARSGRTTEALLAAYRIGARVSWRDMSTTAVRNGVDAGALVAFAELVFAYIDELSASSIAGHTDELATTGRVRQRLLERVAQGLLGGLPEQSVLEAVERAGWEPPTTLTAVLLLESGSVRCSPTSPCAPPTCPTRPTSTRAHCCWYPTPRVGAAQARSCAPSRDAERSPGQPVRGYRPARPTTAHAGHGRTVSARIPRLICPGWCSRRTPRPCQTQRAQAAPAGRLRPATAESSPRRCGPGSCTRGGERGRPRPVRAPADRALPHGPAPRAVRRAARRPGERARTGHRPRRGPTHGSRCPAAVASKAWSRHGEERSSDFRPCLRLMFAAQEGLREASRRLATATWHACGGGRGRYALSGHVRARDLQQAHDRHGHSSGAQRGPRQPPNWLVLKLRIETSRSASPTWSSSPTGTRTTSVTR